MDVGMVIITGLLGWIIGFGAAAYIAADIKEQNENLIEAYKDYIAALENRHDTEEKIRECMEKENAARVELIQTQEEYIAFLKGELEKMKHDMKLLAQNSFSEVTERAGEHK